MAARTMVRSPVRLLLLLCASALQSSRAVKELFTHKEFTDLMSQAKEDGRPIIVDYYSQSCGPCHMIAPVFRKISKDGVGVGVGVGRSDERSAGSPMRGAGA